MRKYYQVIGVSIIDYYVLNIMFSDGVTRKVDFEPFLKSSTNPQIRKYLDPNKFFKYKIVDGDLMWGDYDLLFPIHQLHEGKIA